MKNKSCIVLLGVIFSIHMVTKAATNAGNLQASKDSFTNGLPFAVTVVETSEAKELHEIIQKTVKFLTEKNFDQLDSLANEFLVSKAAWPNGNWKLLNLYAALIPSNKATDSEWKTRLEALHDWVDDRPKSAHARVALAYFLTDYAWRARGTGWANSVTDEGWRVYNQRLLQSEKELKDNEKLAFQCPVAWSVLMTDSLGLSVKKPDYDIIFNRAIHAAPDYEGYYARRAVYLLPRWFGEPGEWERDLAKSADRFGGERGDEVYAQVVWSMRSMSTNVFKENNLSWERVDKGFEVIAKKFPDSLTVKNERAHLAVLARDAVKARKYFEQTQGKVALSEWKSLNHYLRMAHWAYEH